ncbi:hypothetical protein FE257_004504 [Aspergillus nanangensis]|uniref:Uncharacterized protein n=1 Tax=Aspergillus nanangensis TaxID=2582783 RepID=A0AAD4H0M9_ASPNN|nr:hypothetical protein FE257_004504 [Aspergillus nanangensis]
MTTKPSSSEVHLRQYIHDAFLKNLLQISGAASSVSALANDVNLRIMPLGDGVTQAVTATAIASTFTMDLFRTILLITLLTPIASSHSEPVVQQFNAAIPSLVSTRVNTGKKLLTVNMSDSLTTSDLVGGLHPNDGGYNKMSQVWYSGIESAAAYGWIQAPV